MHRRAVMPNPFTRPVPAGMPGPAGRCVPPVRPGPAVGRLLWPGWLSRLSRLTRPAALAGALALAAVFTPVAQAARYALVIGNDAYQPPLRPLQNAAKDARDIAAELRASGFQVPDKWVVINATRRRMDAALQDFLANIGEGDEVVFFYGGHGVEIDAQAALVPVDLSDPSRRPLDNSLRPLTELDQAKRQVLDESITLNRVAADIARKNVAFSLLVVDACRDNPVLDLLRAAHAAYPGANAGPPPEAGLIADAQADTQVLLFSASKGQQSLDRLSNNDPVRNGVFTRVLLDVMRTPGLGLREMLPRVKAEVKRLPASVRLNGQPHRQEPRSMAAFDAPNFYFRVGQGGGVVASTVSPALAPPLVAAGLKPGEVIKDCADCPEMVVIPAGGFMMGSPENEPGRQIYEDSQRGVSVGGFALGKTEVTFAQWDACVAAGGCSHKPNSGWGRGRQPVINVNWDDAQAYVKWLSARTGQRYSLPSGVQWEYAARAGTNTPFNTGATITTVQANIDGRATYGGSATGQFRGRTVLVASFAANAFGLHDMHGNVWEWVLDCSVGKAQDGELPSDGRTPKASGCSRRALRGGSWVSDPKDARSASQLWHAPEDRNSYVGFRLARMLQ